MKKLTVLNLVLVLSLVLSITALAQEGDFGVVQRTADAALDGWKPVISADALYENLNDGDTSNDPVVVSVRSAEHYALGHIPGAINIPWREIAKSENLAKLPTDQPIVVYCYTGHTGQVATTVLRSLGYDVVNLKFGIMGWTLNDEVLVATRFGPDTDQRDYPLETEANEAAETYDYPVLDTGAEDAQEIVRIAADTALADWSPTTSADALFDNLNDGDTSNDPVVVSVRGADHYALGHIAGAINIPWNQIAKAENLAKLPTDQPIVVYCYTGHTGQVAATVLAMLGYDVANLKYGMMSWTADDEVLGTSRYDPATAPDYAVEGTAVEEAAEEAAAPETMPETGGLPFPVEGVLVGFGALTAAAGLYLRRRKAA
ncbi:MAG: rhodanese-like domain-containing protein [Anaerolineae bacterium]|jgi:rhodanese-related sulfurtransferase